MAIKHKMRIELSRRLFIIVALSLAVTLVRASLPSGKPDTLFLSDEVLNIELRTDFTSIRADTSEDPVSYDGRLIYHEPGGKTKKFQVKVRARGDFRRRPDICSFPPIMVNFKKKEVRNTIFNGEDKLKVVTPCQIEEDVLEEFLIYRMYNFATPLSYKVRLAKIKYFDTATEKELFERYSFFIEDDDRMAERLDASKSEEFLTPFDLDRENFMLMSVFEYLIGNKDWFISSRRNVTILRPNDTTKALQVVPYDFDFASLIDASYTKPRNVPERYLSTRRVFKGLCYTKEEFERTFQTFRNLKPLFESLFKVEDLISRSTRNRNLDYLDEFFEIIQNEELFRKEFLETCETRSMYNLPEE